RRHTRFSRDWSSDVCSSDLKDRSYEAQLDAWQGWHSISRPMRQDYVRFVELVNEGARELGYADAGEMWRSGYDMSPVEFAAETRSEERRVGKGGRWRGRTKR